MSWLCRKCGDRLRVRSNYLRCVHCLTKYKLSDHDEEFIDKLRDTTPWTLKGGAETVSRLQQGAIDAGYNLALAGSVVDQGFSNNDLDVFAVRRLELSSAREEDLIKSIEDKGWHTVFKREGVTRNVYTFHHKHINELHLNLFVVNFDGEPSDSSY